MKEPKVACVQHDDVCMIPGGVRRDRSLRWPEDALPGVGYAGLVEDRARLHQGIQTPGLFGPMQRRARMERCDATLCQFVEYFDDFHL